LLATRADATTAAIEHRAQRAMTTQSGFVRPALRPVRREAGIISTPRIFPGMRATISAPCAWGEFALSNLARRQNHA